MCEHAWVLVRYVDHAEIDETDPVWHTAFYVLGCERCRLAAFFPGQNAAQCTPRFLAALEADLVDRGYRLPR